MLVLSQIDDELNAIGRAGGWVAAKREGLARALPFPLFDTYMAGVELVLVGDPLKKDGAGAPVCCLVEGLACGWFGSMPWAWVDGDNEFVVVAACILLGAHNSFAGDHTSGGLPMDHGGPLS
jgi:hypothetical protein